MYGDGVSEYVGLERIHQRVQPPWRPEDLREKFIVLRRRIGRTEEHFEKGSACPPQLAQAHLVILDAAQSLATRAR